MNTFLFVSYWEKDADDGDCGRGDRLGRHLLFGTCTQGKKEFVVVKKIRRARPMYFGDTRRPCPRRQVPPPSQRSASAARRRSVLSTAAAIASNMSDLLAALKRVAHNDGSIECRFGAGSAVCGAPSGLQ